MRSRAKLTTIHALGVEQISASSKVAGSLLGPSAGQLLSNLRAAGYQPEQIDEIYLTHLHADHVGGLMTGDQRTFPNAIVRVNKRDTDHWLSEANMRLVLPGHR